MALQNSHSPILQDFAPLSAALDALTYSPLLRGTRTPLGSMKSLSLTELKRRPLFEGSSTSEREQDSIIDITSEESSSLFDFQIRPPDGEDLNSNSNPLLTPVKPRRDNPNLIRTPSLKFCVSKHIDSPLSDLPVVHSCKSELESLNDTDSESESETIHNFNGLFSSPSPIILNESAELQTSKFRRIDDKSKWPSFYRDCGRSDSESKLTRPNGCSFRNKRRSPVPTRILHRSRSMSSYDFFANTTKLLPHYCSDNGGKYITYSVLHDLLRGKYMDIITNIIIVDCRYEYEFNAGHIKGAINVPYDHKKEFNEIFFKTIADDSKSTAIIFHCEFSQERGPAAARIMRGLDRDINENSYSFSNHSGNLFYPHVYILDGGYKKFFENFPEDCFPRGYRSMFDKDFSDEMANAVKRSHQEKGKKSLSRSLSFTATTLKFDLF